ncbi:MAG: hypothetical protein HY709_08205, partial [Candidatus Latescibacteria bacterium]|nr:hypothetical protein [Candidatus Latescibacterota bacterium]
MGRLFSPRAFVIFVIVLCALFISGTSEAFLDGGIGARSTAMGDAFVSVADDPDAVFANPSGLAQVEKKEITYTNVSLFLTGIEGDNLDQHLIAAALPITPTLAVGVGYQRIGSDLLNENGAVASVSLKMKSDLYLGASVNLLWWKVGEIPNNDPLSDASKLSIGVDAGALYKSPWKANFGLFLKNINQPNMAKEEVQQPFKLDAQGNYVLDASGNKVRDTSVDVSDAGKLPFDLHVGVSYPFTKSLLTAEVVIDDLSGERETRLLVGGEAELVPGFSLRAGGSQFLSENAVGDRPAVQGNVGVGYLS